ncbi:MAG: hypothetical protein WC761_03010 [Candidatus Paceibacterota bacterium]|jgi:hypothetical protein
MAINLFFVHGIKTSQEIEFKRIRAQLRAAQKAGVLSIHLWQLQFSDPSALFGLTDELQQHHIGGRCTTYYTRHCPAEKSRLAYAVCPDGDRFKFFVM